ncbi:hypothetical protein Fmac_028812 [Flemingia macrophylla]|uniref:Lipoxygenase domain-containing protein n=1 Tax=Flemingia macrophylla TaxID=520843 RepID=A0ABD1L8K5_9FABA
MVKAKQLGAFLRLKQLNSTKLQHISQGIAGVERMHPDLLGKKVLGMAVKDEDMNNLTGIQLLMLDYPYATDGLEIWISTKEWVNDFCSFFYKDKEAIEADIELQAWWSEIRTQGHGDKHKDTWWYPMTTLSNLVEALTTLIWIAFSKHASLNYGQYAYNGYPPNCPTLCRKFVP